MAQIQNAEIVNRVIRDLGLVQGTDLRLESSNLVIPTINLSPATEDYIVMGLTESTGTAGTIYTTPASPNKQRFYLTGASLSFVKNALCDIATGVISVAATIGGVGRSIAALSVLTLTAERDSIFVKFEPAIPIDASTNISIGTNTIEIGRAHV